MSESSLREPSLWVARDASELFFINGREEAIAELVTSQSAIALVDEGVFPGDESQLVRYTNIQPGEAVKIDEYDASLEYDKLLGITIVMSAASFGRVACYLPAQSGGDGWEVIRWRDGTWHTRIAVEQLNCSL